MKDQTTIYDQRDKEFAKNDAHMELHQIPLGFLTAPARVHVLGYIKGRTDPKKLFIELVKSLSLSDDNIVWQNNTAFVSGIIPGTKQIILRLDVEARIYTYQIWTYSKNESGLNFGMYFPYPSEISLPKVNKITELDIILHKKQISREDVKSLLPGINILGSDVLNGQVHLMTNYQPDSEGRERYLVFPAKGHGFGDHLGYIVDNIVKVENYYHQLYLPIRKYELAKKRMDKQEFDSAKQLNLINRHLKTVTSEKLKDWIYELTDSFAELATLNEQLNRYLSDAVMYNETLQNALFDFQEKPMADYESLSTPILRNSTRISKDYTKLLSRIENVRRHKAETITILRAKIDLLQREQSFALQHSMHETTKNQMAMQQSIEGLYVFIVAFYLVELIRIVFEMLESRGIIHYPPNELAAYSIPFALAVGLVLSGKVKHWRHEYKLRKKRSKG